MRKSLAGVFCALLVGAILGSTTARAESAEFTITREIRGVSELDAGPGVSMFSTADALTDCVFTWADDVAPPLGTSFRVSIDASEMGFWRASPANEHSPLRSIDCVWVRPEDPLPLSEVIRAVGPYLQVRDVQ